MAFCFAEAWYWTIEQTYEMPTRHRLEFYKQLIRSRQKLKADLDAKTKGR